MKKLTMQELGEICKRHELWNRNSRIGSRAVFQDVDMSGMLIEGKILVNAKFQNVNLEGATFLDTDLFGVTFKNCCLDRVQIPSKTLSREHVRLDYAKFIDTTLRNAKIYNIHFTESRWKRVDISNATLLHCDFSNSWFSHVKGENVDGRNSYFRKSKMNHVHLSQSKFEETNFYKAKMIQSSFEKTNLYKSYFSEAWVWFCDFGESDLREANFNLTWIQKKALKQAKLY